MSNNTLFNAGNIFRGQQNTIGNGTVDTSSLRGQKQLSLPGSGKQELDLGAALVDLFPSTFGGGTGERRLDPALLKLLSPGTLGVGTGEPDLGMALLERGLFKSSEGSTVQGPGSNVPRLNESNATSTPAQRSRYGSDKLLPTLGDLSKPYESRGDPGMVSSGRGDPGGISYGLFQLSTTRGSAQAFVNWTKQNYPEVYEMLKNHRPGTPGFGAAWKSANRALGEQFAAAQHNYMVDQFYNPAVARIAQQVPGFDINKRSEAFKQVAWSTFVQHGPSGGARLIARALNSLPSNATEADAIRKVYDMRFETRNGRLVQFPGVGPGWTSGLLSRRNNELKDALNLLQREQVNPQRAVQ